MKKYYQGQIVAKFTSKKGKEIELRIPKNGDEKGYLDFINSIIAEDDFILLSKPVTDLSEERKWLKNTVENIQKQKTLCLTAFYQNQIIGNTDLLLGKDRRGHVGTFGIVIKKGFREEGIGTKMMEVLFAEAKKLGTSIVELEVFSTNSRVIKVYEKMGFTKHGLLPGAILHRGKYINAILMYKNL